jgi:hypothetical protein
MSHGGVGQGNPGQDPQICKNPSGLPPYRFLDLYNTVPFPLPPYQPHSGHCDTSTATNLKTSYVDETLPDCEVSPITRSDSSAAEDSSINNATAPAIAVVTSNDAAVYEDLNASGVVMDNGHDGAKANANTNTKLEALRAQGRALTSIAQALLMQIQALNTQVDSLS